MWDCKDLSLSPQLGTALKGGGTYVPHHSLTSVQTASFPQCPSQDHFFFFFLRAALAAYGGSQAGGPIGAVAAGLHHSHSDARSKPRLQPTPQLTAMPDP